MRTSKLTEIKKKYKDKKTGEFKELTINHSKVKDRILVFWSDNPRGRIETSTIRQGDTITFKAYIQKDKSDQFSADATGHAYGNTGEEKSFEKLETIAVGRALALLGYLASGEIASSEEMEEFEAYKKNKITEEKQKAMSELENCNTLIELKATFKKYAKFATDKDFVTLKDELKTKLSHHIIAGVDFSTNLDSLDKLKLK